MHFEEVEDKSALIGQAAQRTASARVWRAMAPDGRSLFQIVCMPLNLLELRARGIVNFLPGQEPKAGKLLYMAQWLKPGAGGAIRVTPIVGNYNGGFETYKEAAQICRDVWKAKAKLPPPD